MVIPSVSIHINQGIYLLFQSLLEFTINFWSYSEQNILVLKAVLLQSTRAVLVQLEWTFNVVYKRLHFKVFVASSNQALAYWHIFFFQGCCLTLSKIEGHWRYSTTIQPARNVPGTSTKCPLKVLTSGTTRGPSGNSQGTNTKIDDLMKKLFLVAIVFGFHIYSCFLLEKQIFKCSKCGRPRDIYGVQLQDVPGTKW